MGSQSGVCDSTRIKHRLGIVVFQNCGFYSRAGFIDFEHL